MVSHFPTYQRRPNKVQSGTHPTEKRAVAACLAMIPSAYAAALQQLERLAAVKGMTDKELEQVKKDLERRLRPTIIALC